MSDPRLIQGDCLDVMPTLDAGSVDAIVTDPPYGLAFMGKDWDRFGGRGNANAQADRDAANRGPGAGGNQPFGYSGSAIWGAEQRRRFEEFSRVWAQAALRVLKPGGYMLCFGGTRTYHRLACAIEDAGFEIRDCLMWVYGSGFPKGQGCLKPSYEPILLARRPGARVLPLGIDECRVPTRPERPETLAPSSVNGHRRCMAGPLERVDYDDTRGRYPANLVHDGSPEVLEAFAAFGERAGGAFRANEADEVTGDNTGTAARFFYTAKASRSERGEDNTHPTVKPLALMRWLVRLVCPPGGMVLDPFLGSGSTGVACWREDRDFIGIEVDPAYHAMASARIEAEQASMPLFRDVEANGGLHKGKGTSAPLFPG